MLNAQSYLTDEVIDSLSGQNLDIVVQNFVFHQEISFRQRESDKTIYPVSLGSMQDEYEIPEYHNTAFNLLFNLLMARRGNPFSIGISAISDQPEVNCRIQFRDDWSVEASAENPATALARAALKAELKYRETSGAITLRNTEQQEETQDAKQKNIRLVTQ